MRDMMLMCMVAEGAVIIILFVILAALARELGRAEGKLSTHEALFEEAKTVDIGTRRG